MSYRTRQWTKTIALLAVSGLLSLSTSVVALQLDASDEQGPRETQNQTPTETEEQQGGAAQQRPDQESADQESSDSKDSTKQKAKQQKARTETPPPPQEERAAEVQATEERSDQQRTNQNRANQDQSDQNRSDSRNPDRQRGRRDSQSQESDNASANDRRGQDAASSGRRQGRIGIEFDAQAERPLTIARIEPNSRAAQAGLRAGDRIISVDGRQIANVRQLQAYVSGQQNRWIPLVIDRGGNQYSIQLSPSTSSDDGAWLGVYLQDSEDQEGAQVTSVYPASPAARAGIRTGDTIVSANGQRVANAPDLIAAVEELEPRSRTELVVRRGDQELTIPVVLGRRDSFVAGYRGFDSNFGQGNEDDGDFASFPPYAMQLEHDRRNAEQHQRIETEIQKLREEIKQLRELIEQKK